MRRRSAPASCRAARVRAATAIVLDRFITAGFLWRRFTATATDHLTVGKPNFSNHNAEGVPGQRASAGPLLQRSHEAAP